MEGVEAGFKTVLKEAATALLGRNLDIRNGEVFRLSWSNLGYGSCVIGPRRERERGSPSAHVNLVDLPRDPNTPRLWLQLATDGWVNIQNVGKEPLTLLLSHPEPDRFRYVYTKDFSHKEADRKGIAVLEPGEMATTKHEGSPLKATWQAADKKVELTLRGVSMITPVRSEPGIAVKYESK